MTTTSKPTARKAATDKAEKNMRAIRKADSARRTTKATPKVKGKFAKRGTIVTKVVRLRDKNHQSWATIGAEVDCAPRTARRLYDESKGTGAHHGLLPGKGGRSVAKPTPKAKARKVPATK